MDQPDIGHNSGDTSPENHTDNQSHKPDPEPNTGGVAADRLQSFIDRIERLEEEKKALADDIREVYSEAKRSGFDIKVIRQIIRLRKMDATDRREQEEILAVYMRALGMDDTPLFNGGAL